MNELGKLNPQCIEHPLYGPFLDGLWVPAPRYALRRNRLLHFFAKQSTGSVIEFGCGAGALLSDLAILGNSCTGVESSSQAREIASFMLENSPTTRIYADTSYVDPKSFDYLISCDVLEHIEDDGSTLNDWLEFLKPGGTVVIAVPAHQKRYGPLDKWAGHVRRYDKQDILKLFKYCNLSLESLECYGYPLANLTSFVRNRKMKKDQRSSSETNPQIATAKSGVDRQADLKVFRLQTSLGGKIAMKSAFQLQRLFLRTNLGDGYLAIGQKPS